MTKQTKTKIGLGSVVKAKVGELERITREGRIRRMRREEVEMEELITLFPEIEEGVPLTINGDPPDGEPCIFVKGMYLSVFYCLCYDKT